MGDSTSYCQLNQGKADYEFESNEVPEPLSVVNGQFVLKVGMTFTTLEDAGKFYRNYAKAAGFSTRVQSTNRKGNEIKNQLIICSREGKWNSHSKDSFDRNWNDFLLNFGLVDNKWLSDLYADRHMGSNLSGSPLLGRDEKHIKEREHAFIF
ncbi:Transposon protein [Arachis hypogaea]|nr:Transposon protein [Arachis hypogaea]